MGVRGPRRITTRFIVTCIPLDFTASNINFISADFALTLNFDQLIFIFSHRVLFDSVSGRSLKSSPRNGDPLIANRILVHECEFAKLNVFSNLQRLYRYQMLDVRADTILYVRKVLGQRGFK